MRFDAQREIKEAVTNIITGFAIAFGVAAAKWVTTLIKLPGFNLKF